jgi:hypothetical protein
MSDSEMVDPRDRYARQVNGAFVVVVEVSGGSFRRRTFHSIRAAETAARNALAQGHNAKIFLCELRPVFRMTGHEHQGAP